MTMTSKKKIHFVLSVDTEEEWNWQDAFPQTDYGLNNIDTLLSFQSFCENLGAKPTYFVDYAVLNSDSAAQVIQQLYVRQGCEIGAHLHPWNNPPYFGSTTDFESHVINLPEEQVRAKLSELVTKLESTLGGRPTSFRTGRWGINSMVLGLLRDFGFKVDSSVIPFYRTRYFDCYESPLVPYFPDWEHTNEPSDQRELLEMPVTSGFNRLDFDAAANTHQLLSQPLFRPLKLVGIAWHTNLLRKMFLSPELSEPEDMKTLCDKAVANGHPVLHMFLHSSSLIDNPNSQVANEDAYNRITESIESLISWLKGKYDVEFCTVTEYAAKVEQGLV